MKDQYVGDINDFVKYRLLRLAAPAFDKVVVGWMLTDDDDRTDGGRTQYLADPEKRQIDPELFDSLRKLVTGGDRSVSAIEGSGILPLAEFESSRMPSGRIARMEYFRGLANRAGSNALVFLDPDNGLEVPSSPKHRPVAKKFVYWDEVAVLRDAGASVLIYQHFPRVARIDFVNRLLEKLETEMGPDYGTFCVHSAQVAFLFAIRSTAAECVRTTIAEGCEGSAIPLVVTPGERN